ncbi:sigma-70 family RNA polymerase sigma factor [Tatumella sp. TA1]|uniref:sigma-70 family RNA polymerase sigma factor n=1 Tax=Rosenbergiella collisarenosi TaxID=1544695 RepID=UPI0008F88721|nr:sigma-70 family RNA polymerase sigma factor [Rosenbergiella collisarenosi]MBT0721770.1 sigma-70 family RNA polymerase sigma factor [Rosenbergiella collisarenosi]QGX92907.1 sigma-70 family RNA polymerase sigma factor [Tatumella sp. TA1]
MVPNATDKQQWPALMKLAQCGSQQAYERLLGALLPVIRAQVSKQIYDRGNVEDVIQDVLLTVHRVRHTYDSDYPFMPWLQAIVRARCIDALRRQGYRRYEVIDDEYGEEAAAEGNVIPDEQLLGHYLQQLPARQREMVEFVHLNEKSLAEAASHHQLSLSAVKSLLHRALVNLRRIGEKNE